MKKFSVQKTSNGYIVRIINGGEGCFKEPYEKDVVVFMDLKGLQVWIDKFLSGK